MAFSSDKRIDKTRTHREKKRTKTRKYQRNLKVDANEARLLHHDFAVRFLTGVYSRGESI